MEGENSRWWNLVVLWSLSEEMCECRSQKMSLEVTWVKTSDKRKKKQRKKRKKETPGRESVGAKPIC